MPLPPQGQYLSGGECLLRVGCQPLADSLHGGSPAAHGYKGAAQVHVMQQDGLKGYGAGWFGHKVPDDAEGWRWLPEHPAQEICVPSQVGAAS